jgi:hypothetical protein
MKHRFLITAALLLLPGAVWAWSGDTWGPITRATIQANADQMIDSRWVPKTTFTNWAYTSSSSGNDVYYTYNAGSTYTGVSYSQTYGVTGMVQENWAQFSNSVSNTSGGTVAYGNDCSGFTSICWKLPARNTTATFESRLGTYWISLGATGTAVTASLVMGDALNSSSVGHIVIFLNYESTGVRTMEQTPSHAQRKVRTYDNLAAYRPIRRLQITEPPLLTADLLSRVVDVGSSVSFVVSPTAVTPYTYKWQFNGNTIAGATASSYTISAAQLTNAGQYVCIITNSVGITTSRVASLTVYPPQTTVFLDTFDTNSAALWTLNKSSSDTRATFYYDYSGLGIPSAPHSTGGTTRGLRMDANLTAGVVAALSLSPTNRSFAGDYRLRFDLWMNANGPFPNGGNGSSQHTTAGLGTAGNRVEWTGSGTTADGFYFAVDGEGQAGDTNTASGDFCAYAGTSLKASTSGVYEAGSNATAKGNVDPYYVDAFPTGKTPPTTQLANYTNQYGLCAQGTIGFAWHEVIVARRGTTVDWAIDGIRLATISNATFTASNVCVGYWDMFSSLSDNTNVTFGLVDNVRVEMPVVAPAITGQPQSQTVVQGVNATFAVAVTGTPAPGYQWRYNGASLSGGTASAYTVPKAQPANAGSYTVVVTNSGGSVTSAVAALTVNVPPTIPAPLPPSLVVTQGANVTLCVTVAGALPLTFQWRLNGNNLGGATASCYTRNNVQTTDAGTYSVSVSNVAGSASCSTILSVMVPSLPPAQSGHFDSICRLLDGTLQLRISGAAGSNYCLEWTSDWLAWSNLCTLSGPEGQFCLTDPGATNAGQRFYRLRLTP